MRYPTLTIFTAVALVILFCLGTWQLHRLSWKTDLIAAVDERIAADPVPFAGHTELPPYTPVSLDGFFIPGRVAHVSGTFEGASGWYVFQPFQWLDGADYGGVVMVGRGFVDLDARAESYPTPEGAVVITGLLRDFSTPSSFAAAFIAPHDDTNGSFYSREREKLLPYFFPDTADLDQVSMVYIDQRADGAATTVPRAGTTRVEFSNNHLGYALTWYGLGIGLAVMFFLKRREWTG